MALAKKTLTVSDTIITNIIELKKTKDFNPEIFAFITYVEITPIQNIKVKGLTVFTKNPLVQKLR